MSQSKLRPKRSQTTTGHWIPLVAFLYFDNPIVIRIACKTSHSVCRDLVLKVNFRDWRTEVVRMQVLLSGNVPEFDACPVFDVKQFRIVHPVRFRVVIVGRIDDTPVIVLIDMRIQRDLLLCECGDK